MPHILLVEDSKTFASLLRRKIETELEYGVTWANSYAQAAEILSTGQAEFSAALLDLNLPDAMQGEIVDLVAGSGVPSLVFTAEMNDELRRRVWSKGIVDYIMKEGMENLDYICDLLTRIHANPQRTVLVVDDSSTYRNMLVNLLKVHKYTVIEAANGNEALEVLQANPQVKLVITDYEMPNLDGSQMIKEMRRKRAKDDLAIIGMSSHDNELLSAKFIKSGANDFLHKNFITEEFYCRVVQNFEMQGYISKIRDMANQDFLTKLSNRRYFFEKAQALYSAAKASGEGLALVMLDIDRFKQVNDTLGHDAGDAVIKHLAQALIREFGDLALTARLGGEEFCALALASQLPYPVGAFEAFRELIAGSPVRHAGKEIKYTVSIGVSQNPAQDLDGMLKLADELLYQAKQGGRNQLCSG